MIMAHVEHTRALDGEGNALGSDADVATIEGVGVDGGEETIKCAVKESGLSGRS